MPLPKDKLLKTKNFKKKDFVLWTEKIVWFDMSSDGKLKSARLVFPLRVELELFYPDGFQ